MAEVIAITAKVSDLVGTMVPFDVTKDDWMIGHHVECRTIIAAQNYAAYIVNGDVLIPNAIVVTLLELLAKRQNEAAAAGRPQMTAWTATPRHVSRFPRLERLRGLFMRYREPLVLFLLFVMVILVALFTGTGDTHGLDHSSFDSRVLPGADTHDPARAPTLPERSGDDRPMAYP